MKKNKKPPKVHGCKTKDCKDCETAYESVKRGLKDAKEGRIKELDYKSARDKSKQIK
jgi:hypothetical protein